MTCFLYETRENAFTSRGNVRALPSDTSLRVLGDSADVFWVEASLSGGPIQGFINKSEVGDELVINRTGPGGGVLGGDGAVKRI